MDPFFSILPNLGVGVAAVVVMYLMIKAFLAALTEQQKAFRELESDVRRNLTDQLTKNTVALTDVARLLARVGRTLEEP